MLGAMSDTDKAVYRIAIALKTVEMFRQALEANGGRYHGGLVPNLTSITDVLCLPFDVLEKQMIPYPQLVPSEAELNGLKQAIL